LRDSRQQTGEAELNGVREEGATERVVVVVEASRSSAKRCKFAIISSIDSPIEKTWQKPINIPETSHL
jgi:hypothetical protein